MDVLQVVVGKVEVSVEEEVDVAEENVVEEDMAEEDVRDVVVNNHCMNGN